MSIFSRKKKNQFNYIDKGEGTPIVFLHGLLGGLSNFDKIIGNLSDDGFRVIVPALPILDLPLLKTNVGSLTEYVHDLLQSIEVKKAIFVGNSLGGHIALVYAKNYPDEILGLVLTGSSGLYENSMGESYPKRGDYDYIKKKAQEVFFEPETATKEMIDDIYEIVNNRNKAIRILSIAKSAIRHNMAKDVQKMDHKTLLIWGKNDIVTPPEVAEEFHSLLKNSELHWIDNCGHAPMMERPEEFDRILESWIANNFK